ncbi:MAG: ABC transporter permease subunit [Coprobacillus sp.]
MLNFTLFKKEVKTNYKVLCIFLALIAMYSSVIVIMFDPELGKSLDVMAKSMPEVFAAFGMLNVGSTLIEFVSNYLYGFILTAVPLVCVIVIANRLVARYVDNGSMSYLLASPHSRREIITSQAITLIITIFIMVLFATGLIILVSGLCFPGELDIQKFIVVNIGLFGLLLFMGSLCFLSSCLFNDTRKTNGIGGGIIIGSILLQMISQVGEKFEFLKYATPLTLFDVNGLLASSQNAYLMIGVLYALAVIVFIIAISIFTKKDLSI